MTIDKVVRLDHRSDQVPCVPEHEVMGGCHQRGGGGHGVRGEL